jgi:hypothetical protein
MGNVVDLICYLQFLKNGGFWAPVKYEVIFDDGLKNEYNAQSEDSDELIIPDDDVYQHYDEKKDEEYLTVSKVIDEDIKEIIKGVANLENPPKHVRYKISN